MPVLTEKLAQFKGHRWQISCLAFNQDGSLLASGGWDKEVNIWDVSSFELVHTLKGAHRVPVTSVCWSPYGNRLICSGSADHTAVLWHAETGNRIASLSEHFGWVLGTCFSRNGNYLATASWDQMVRIWDPNTETLINNLKGHNGGVWSVDFHPRSPTLCSASQDGTVKVWDARTNKVVRTLSNDGSEPIYCAKWSPNGAIIASGSADTKVCVWEPSTGSVINTIYGHIDTVKSVAFNPNTENVALPVLASAGDFTIHLSDPRPTQKAELLTLSPHLPGKEVEALTISPDGAMLVSGGRDGMLVLMTLFVPSLVAQSNSHYQKSISSMLRKSRHLRDRSYICDATADDISVVSSEPFGSRDDLQAELEADALDSILTNRNISQSEADTSRISAIAKMKRMSRLGVKEVDLGDHATVKRKGLSARASREKRTKEKAVDLPTMIAHLAANTRAYGPEELASSSSESEEGIEQTPTNGQQDLLINVNSRVSEFAGLNKTSVQEAISIPPPQRLSLLPDEVVGKLKNRRGVFEKKDEDSASELEEEIIVETEVKDKRASVSTGTDDFADDEYYSNLVPEDLESPRHLPQDDSTNFDSESLMHQSGNYSMNSPDYLLNSSLRFEDFEQNRDPNRKQFSTSSPLNSSDHSQPPSHLPYSRQAFSQTLPTPLEEEVEDDFANELGSGDEYGEDVPLSMI